MVQIHQINLQAAVGGGEVYTRWFSRALADAGAKVFLYVHESNRFWDGLNSASIEVVSVKRWESIFDALPARGGVLLTQSRMPSQYIERASSDHLLSGFSHMPMTGRSAAEFGRYSTVFTVSRYCIDLLIQAGISQVYRVPLYGVAELDGRRAVDRSTENWIAQSSPYTWDKRKGRDRLLAHLEPFFRPFRKRLPFRKKPGLTLGVVSLISPIKQFPALFSLLAPHIARHPQVNLEIFGNGGYAQLRDLKRSLQPLADRVRFWGYQEAVGCVYQELDYLMVGLPEKEALGLNALEAQALGTPVLAPKAPPFTETVVQEETGFLYCDPRSDGGRDFGALLASLVGGRVRPDPRLATQHLARFRYAAMVERAGAVIKHLESGRLARFEQ